MNVRKRNIIIIISLLLLIIAISVLIFKNKKSTIDVDNFYVKDLSTVTKVFIADKSENTILIEKQPDSTWILNEKYDANMPLVDLVLRTLNTMRIRYPVSKSALSNTIKTLSSSGIKVEVYQKVYTINIGDKIKLFPKEKLTKVYYIGHETQDNLGSYVFLEGENAPYVAHIPGHRGFLSPRFNTSETAWRSRKIVDLDVHALKSIKVEVPKNPEESYEITNSNNDIKVKLLSSGVILPSFDTLHMAQTLSSFVNLNFDEFASAIPSLQIDSVFTKSPEYIVTITDTSNVSTTLKTYVKLANHYIQDPEDEEDPFAEIFDVSRLYAVINDSDTVLIQYYNFDNILQPASYFFSRF